MRSGGRQRVRQTVSLDRHDARHPQESADAAGRNQHGGSAVHDRVGTQHPGPRNAPTDRVGDRGHPGRQVTLVGADAVRSLTEAVTGDARGGGTVSGDAPGVAGHGVDVEPHHHRDGALAVEPEQRSVGTCQSSCRRLGHFDGLPDRRQWSRSELRLRVYRYGEREDGHDRGDHRDRGAPWDTYRHGPSPDSFRSSGFRDIAMRPRKRASGFRPSLDPVALDVAVRRVEGWCDGPGYPRWGLWLTLRVCGQ